MVVQIPEKSLTNEKESQGKNPQKEIFREQPHDVSVQSSHLLLCNWDEVRVMLYPDYDRQPAKYQHSKKITQTVVHRKRRFLGARLAGRLHDSIQYR